MLRKSVLVGGICMLYSFGVEVQIPFALMVLVLSLAVDYSLEPYCWKALQSLERTSLIVLIFTFQAASLSHSPYFDSVYVEVFMVLINIFFLIYFLYGTRSYIISLFNKLRDILKGGKFRHIGSRIVIDSTVQMVENPLNKLSSTNNIRTAQMAENPMNKKSITV